MATNRADAKLEMKPKRVPMGRRDVLAVTGINENEFVPRWMNDIDDRLQRALEAGYSFVDSAGITVGDATPESVRGGGSVMTKRVGNGTVAYLMKIPKEWYDQDQKAKDAKISHLEAEMKKELTDKAQGRYGSVSVEQKDHA